jgi:HAD superfamily hydrolase (TIGR01549 family)
LAARLGVHTLKEYEAYLFDWDGTIARTLEEWLALKRESFEAVGMKKLTDSEIVGTFGRLEQAAYELGLPKSNWSMFISFIDEKAKVRIPKAELYDGIEDVFRKLKNQGKRIGLITTIPRGVLGDVLSDHKLSSYFDIIVAGDDVENNKPDPEGIELALTKLNIVKSQAIMLGDSKHDIGAANNAGIDSVLYYPASHSLFYDIESLKELKPTRIISDWGELLNAD